MEGNFAFENLTACDKDHSEEDSKSKLCSGLTEMPFYQEDISTETSIYILVEQFELIDTHLK